VSSFRGSLHLIEREETGFRKIYPSSNDPEFVAAIVSKIGTVKDIKMCGIALNFLWDPDIVIRLKEAAESRKTRVTILVADVDSPQIKERLNEEEDYPYPSQHGREVIMNLYKRLKEIERTIGNKEFFNVRVFAHYPTFALIIAGDDVFCYHYGYKTVGTVSPVLHLRGFSSHQVRYYRTQFDKILENYPLQ